jgi:uncharacterized protein with HEPN domain
MFKRSMRLYSQDIKEAIEGIFLYTQDLSLDEFKKDRMRYSAVIREFQIIGEAVGKLDSSIKQQHPHIAWQDIKDFRNLLIHQYFGVDLDIVWTVIQEDLPQLYETVTIIINSSEAY